MASRSYGGVTISLTGDSELVGGLRRLADVFPSLAHAALLAEVESVLPMLTTLTPIGGPEERDRHVGRLRASAHIQENGDLGAALVIGGGDVPYALAQETRAYQHPHGGERYYFADAIHAEQPLFLQRLSDRLAPVIENLGGAS
jgi:hypothetical protein